MLPRLFFLVLLAAATANAQDEKAAEPKIPAEPKKASTLAPTVSYLEMWGFLHGADPTIKAILVPKPDDDAADEPPSWLTSAAMAFKEGRKKSAAFGLVAHADAMRVAQRFGIEEESLPAVVGIAVKDGGGRFNVMKRVRAGSETLKAVRKTVQGLISGEAGEESPTLPSFPQPTRPRKQATASLDEFNHETIGLKCFNGNRPLCVLAVLDTKAGDGCPPSVAELAKRFRNDQTLTFGCVGAARQTDFLKGLALEQSDLPALLAVKGAGKRPRAARMPSPESGSSPLEEVDAMATFVDGVIGGGVTFKRLSDGLPELEPPYLMDAEEKDEM